jgi:tetratricopeptide (TPR) repeat protein
MGYREAERIRVQNKQDQVAAVATEHFMAGLVAHQNKQYDLARTQYEYVIKLDPSFPGVQDKLREVMIASAIKNTPTPVPTEVIPTLTPTLDTRPQQDIYTQVRQEYANQNWEAFFATVDSLRRIDPAYQAVQVDGMLYFAFRFRGIDKIIHQANLEGGLYDLALAERFAPLDVDALGYRNWARMYLNGASFWQIDWEKVMAYFEEIYPYFPNMRDASGLTAIERYRIAAKGQGDKLNASGDYCGALDYYQRSLQAVADGALEQTATAVYSLCYPPTEIPTITPTPTLSPTGEVPVETTEPAPEPTTEVTVQPTDQSGNP